LSKSRNQYTSEFLGVELDDKIRWKQHIDNTSNKANKMLNLIKRNFWFCDEATKRTLYTTLVRPKLEYACVAWDPHFKCDINRLERIQRSAARFCTNNYNWTSSVTDMLNKLELDTFENRRRKARLAFMYKIINNHIDINISNFLVFNNETRTRSSHKYLNIKSLLNLLVRKMYSDFPFFPRTARDWNNLPVEMFTATSLNNFMSNLE